jgi:hypothetical protein
MRFVAFSAAAVLAASSVALGGRLDRSVIPTDPSFVIHLDMEALAASSLGEMLLGGELIPDVKQARAQAMNEIGMDPVEEIMGITLYGDGEDIEAATIVVHCSEAVDGLVLGLAEAEEKPEGYDSFEKDGQTVHELGGEAYACVLEAEEGRFIVMSDNLKRTLAGVRVIEGDTPNFTDAKSPALVLKPGKGALIYAEIAMPADLPDFEPVSEIIKQTKSIQMQIAEREDQVQAALAIDAGSEELATDISEVLTGVIAMGRMVAAEQPEMAFLKDVSRGLTVKARGTKIAAILECDLEMIETIATEALGYHEPCDEDDDDDWDDDDDEDEDW